VVQRHRARERIPECSKEVHANCGRFVDQLQQGLTGHRIRVDMMEKERRRHRVRNRTESMHDEVDVVQGAPFDTTTVRAQLTGDRQPSGQGARHAMGQDGVNRRGRSTRISLV